jgi:hypothetical protein
LAERHVPYVFVPDDRLGPETLRHVKVLLMPNTAALSDETIAGVRDYVKGGGTIVADFQTSLFDEKGKRRDDFALADVFGVSFAGRVLDAPRNSPLQIRRRHALLAGWEQTDFLLNGGRMAACGPRGAEVIATRVPAPPAAVPEEGWLRALDTDEVAIAVHRFGSGQAIYFAHEIMRQSREDGHDDFAGLVGRAIDLGRGSSPVLRTDAPPSVRIALLGDGRGAYTLSMVNHTSTPYRPMHARVPVRDFEVVLRLPESRLASSLVMHGAHPIAVEAAAGGAVRIRVTRLDAFAAVALQMNAKPAGQR